MKRLLYIRLCLCLENPSRLKHHNNTRNHKDDPDHENTSILGNDTAPIARFIVAAIANLIE